MNASKNIKTLPLEEARYLRDGAERKRADRMFIAGYLLGLRLLTRKTVNDVAAETRIPARRIDQIEQGKCVYMTLGIFHKLCVAYGHPGGHGYVPERFHSDFLFDTTFLVRIQFFPEEAER